MSHSDSPIHHPIIIYTSLFPFRQVIIIYILEVISLYQGYLIIMSSQVYMYQFPFTNVTLAGSLDVCVYVCVCVSLEKYCINLTIIIIGVV